MNLALIHAQPFKYLAAAAEHERGAKSNDGPESRRLDNLPSQQHQVDQKREASAERMPRELKLCALAVLAQMLDYFGHELRVDSLRGFVNPSVNKAICFLRT